MKKLDEMDRNIQLRAEEIAYKVTLVLLSVWTFYNCWQTLMNGEKYNVIPGLIVCLTISIQSFSQIIIKRKMIDGDDEYHEPNKLIWIIIAVLAVAAVILSIGTYLTLKA